MPYLKLLTSLILLIYLSSFWACSNDNDKDIKTILLEGEPSEEHSLLSQKYFEKGY